MAMSKTDAGRGVPEPGATQPLGTAPRTEPAGPMPHAGDVLGDRYELAEVIGRGGMSTVYSARDNRTGRDVAVKVFRPGTDLIDADERYRREAEILFELDAPGLIAMLDAEMGDTATSNGPRYLVTELVDGCTLADAIRQSPLTENEVARLGAALSRTLAYVHDRGIVHRDVKPANILIPGTTRADLEVPKLVDFGIAVAADGVRLTTDGATVGTANYLSPEQVHGDPVTPASDVFSLGLVLIEALTGTIAYPGTGVEAALARLHRAPAIPAAVSRRLRAALKDMTARDPRNRPDARRVAARFDELADSLTDEILSFGQSAAERRPAGALKARRTRRRRAVVGAIAAVALASSTVLVAVITAASPAVPEPPRLVMHAPEPAATQQNSSAPQAVDPRPTQAPRHRYAPPLLVPITAAQQLRGDVDDSPEQHKGKGKHDKDKG